MNSSTASSTWQCEMCGLNVPKDEAILHLSFHWEINREALRDDEKED